MSAEIHMHKYINVHAMIGLLYTTCAVLHSVLPFSKLCKNLTSVLFLTEINEQTTHMGEQILKWICL